MLDHGNMAVGADRQRGSRCHAMSQSGSIKTSDCGEMVTLKMKH